MDAAHETLQRVLEAKKKISSFLIKMKKKQGLLSAWSADEFNIRLAYRVDIFRQLNRLNLELQGKGSLIIYLSTKSKRSFVRITGGEKLEWETVSEIPKECDVEALEGDFKRYFLDI